MNRNVKKQGFSTRILASVIIVITSINSFATLGAAKSNAPTSKIAVGAATITSGLVGFWNFDESSGSIIGDGSGQKRNGTIRGNSARVAGKNGNALKFSAAGDYVQLPATTFGNSDYTIAAWIKTGASNAYLAGNADGSDLRIVGGRAFFGVYTPGNGRFNNLQSKKSVNDNQWHHVVAVRSGDTMQIYVDNALDNSLSISGAANVGFQALGARYAGVTPEFYNGVLDEVYVYNRAVSATEVSALFGNNGTVPTADTTPPTAAISSPAAGATVSGSVTISASASDNVGVAGVEFLLDGASLGADTSNPYAVSWNTAQVANGNHVLTVVARDTAGNTAQSPTVSVYVNNGTTTTPTPNTPTADCSGSNCITVNGSQTFQTITGWEATSFTGHEYSPAWNNYKNNLYDQAVNDLGINRIRLEIKSGAENPVDHYARWRAGQISESDYNARRYEIVNDDANPNSINPSGFQWSQIDSAVDNIVLPLRQRLAARGEQLSVNVNYVDFGASGFEHKNNPAEYAEFVLATYRHLQSKYGFVPDSWEVILEPDSATAVWSATQVGQAIKAAGDLLTANGFTPRFVAPSTTNGANAPIYFNTIAQTGGALAYIEEISYHRYCCVDAAKAQEIAALAARYGKKTAMLEWMGADYHTLHEDLKYGNNSAWQQFTLATLAEWGADSGDAYYRIDGANPANPILTLSSRAKFLRQYFKYVRRGAVRLGASSASGAFDPLAFRNADGKHVVVVKASGGGTFAVKGLPAGTYGVFYTTGNADGQQSATQSIANGQTISASIPAAGVITIYAQNSAGNPTPTPTPTVTPTPTPFPTPQVTPTPNPTPTPTVTPTPQTPMPANALFVAPNGSPNGSGTQSSPWDLQTALNQPASATQGKTIYLRGGTYYGKFISNLVGAVVRSYPGEWARVDGNFTTTTAVPMAAASSFTASNVSFNSSVRFAPGNSVFIENEMVQINSVNADGSYRVIRGWSGTTAAAHSSGAAVRSFGNTFEVNGSNTTYRDFEVFDSNPIRSYVTDGSYAGSLRGGDGFMVFGDDLKFINLVVHDNTDGFFLAEGADNTEVYGAIIYNNGFVASDRPHGHGLYVQNLTGRKTVSDVISFNNFALGMKVYGANQGHSNGVYFDGVTSFNNGSPGYYPGNPTPFPNDTNRRYGNLEIGSDVYPSTDVSVTNSYLYHQPGKTVEIPGLYLGRAPSGGNTNAVIKDNYIAEPNDPLAFNSWSSVQVTGNTFYQYENSFGKVALVRGVNAGNVWDNNTYFAPSAILNCLTGQKRAPFYAYGITGTCGGGGALDFNEWKQATGFDASSTFSAARPTGKQIFVRANRYETGRANITIYNWDRSTSVAIDLSNAGLAPGQRFEIRNVQDYFGAPVLSNQSYTVGAPLTVPLSGLSVAKPIGHSYTPASTCPEFCVFEVVPLN